VGGIGLAKQGHFGYNCPPSGTTGQLTETVYHFPETGRKPLFFESRHAGQCANHLCKEFSMDIYITTHFCGGHHLRGYPGDCENPHGHNWKIKVTVRAERLDPLGMGIDFRQLKRAVAAVIDELDHRNLNDHQAFRDRNPSSEHIAMFLFDSLREPLHSDRYALYSVEVLETDTSGVVYYGD
jgi:6-pyruvoyltetrahydropterin/6-carboxytetrahydropterin synthase